MLPALPTGRQCTSGASPSASMISNDAVFCPSMRNGLIELTTDTPSMSPSARTTSSAWSKLPRICTTCAPWISACASLPSAIFPSGITTAHVMPARAAYAAALADVLPVDAQTTTLAPSSTALVMAIVMPRSLNDPVGFAPSTFRWTSSPSSSERRGAEIKGVFPSSSVITGVVSVTGRCSRYASMSPGHGRRFAVTDVPRSRAVAEDAQHRADAVHGPDVTQPVDRGPQVGLPCGVRDEDQARLAADPRLLHRLDRHAVRAELLRDGGEHTGLVGHLELQVELALDLVDRPDGLAGEGADRGAAGAAR